MAWTLTGDVAEYLAAAGGFLRSRAAENTVQLAATETIRVRVRGPAAFGDEAPLFGWWAAPGGPVTAAFMHTLPFGVTLTPSPAGAAAALAETFAGRGRFPAWVMADTTTAPSFAAAWERQTGHRPAFGRRSRLYRLRRLLPPDPAPPGRARVATAADSGLILAWLEAFGREADYYGGPALRRTLADRSATAASRCGRPAAGRSPWPGRPRPWPARPGSGRCTPPERRGQGFGGTVTAAVSRAAKDAGVGEVLLYTDLANPTSNALHQRLSYEPVSDSVQLLFLPAPVRQP